MGCAASTTAQAPTQPQAGQQASVQIVSSSGQQPSARPVAATQMRTPPQQNAQRGPNLTNASIIRSLVSLKREDCSIERAQEGHFLKLKVSSASGGEVVVFFLAKVAGEDGGKDLPELEANQVSRQTFSRGSSQAFRVFLCKDLSASLEGFKEDKERYTLVVDLRADSSDARAITVERSFLKLNSEGTSAQIVSQMVKCGSAIRTLQALYGTLPNPRLGRENTSGDPESGECVICLSKPREVAILHCRHVCLCRSCATITSSTWSFQCPVCRGRVAAMVGTENSA
mmetsp:Transcript_33007/g.60111  ORF Transcript_33007/g.60111 Transcript_33007/m.60111 type:complete len:285 (+) Transcript_33007:156-1010(+)